MHFASGRSPLRLCSGGGFAAAGLDLLHPHLHIDTPLPNQERHLCSNHQNGRLTSQQLLPHQQSHLNLPSPSPHPHLLNPNAPPITSPFDPPNSQCGTAVRLAPALSKTSHPSASSRKSSSCKPSTMPPPSHSSSSRRSRPENHFPLTWYSAGGV